MEAAIDMYGAPWGDAGIAIDNATTTSDALAECGLDWDVELRPVYAKNGGVTRLDDYKAVFRSDTHDNIGMVGANYTPVQNAEAFAVFEDLVRDHGFTFEGGGMRREGRQVWLQAKMPGVTEPVVGDIVERRLTLSNGHDGTSSLRIALLAMRLICNNGLKVAAEGSSRIYLRHTASIAGRLAEAATLLGIATTAAEEFDEFASALADLQMSTASLANFVAAVIPIAADAENTDLATGRREIITGLFENGRGMDHPGVAGTGWAALNAVTEYTTWHKGRSQEARWNGMFVGQNDAMNQRAVQHLHVQLRAA